MKKDELKLVKTCNACPEQYDVFDKNEKEIGYLRLRHGTFRVDCPFGNTIFQTREIKGGGEFENDERDFWLNKAKDLIINHYIKDKLKEI